MKLHSSIEDDQSFELYQERQRVKYYSDAIDESIISTSSTGSTHQQHRQLKQKDKDEKEKEKEKKEKDEKDKKKNKKKKKILKAQHGKKTQHGIMIDAGSQGTRVHIYEFKARVLKKKNDIENVIHGLRLSAPTTDTRWTDRLKPGLDSFAYIDDYNTMYTQVKIYLTPIFDFVKNVLEDKEKYWYQYPIYLKATGGLRSLPRPYRIKLINCVRTIMKDTKFNPFLFEEEHTRVISGEEEAIYGWTAVNFVKGNLITESEGIGRVAETSKTYGVLEMGGASAQIGFFEPNGDVMANLFKLQIGASKHWNVYVHSFLYFGVNLAFEQLNAELYIDAITRQEKQESLKEEMDNSTVTTIPVNDDSSTVNGIYNPCLPGKSEYLFSSRVHALPNHTFVPLSSPDDLSVIVAEQYSTIMKNKYEHGNYDKCNDRVQRILRKDANAWCNFAHDRDCSLAGIYQPQLPVFAEDSKYFGEFIATSNFYEIFEFLELAGVDVSLHTIREKTKVICNMSMEELIEYNNLRDKPLDDDDLLESCFRATFVSAYLIDGFGFPESYKITSADVINGQKLNWALGSMIYEINTLPWEFKKHSKWVPDILAEIAPSNLLENMTFNEHTENVIDNMFVLVLMTSVFAILYTVVKEVKRHVKDLRNNRNSINNRANANASASELNTLLSPLEHSNMVSTGSYQSNSIAKQVKFTNGTNE